MERMEKMQLDSTPMDAPASQSWSVDQSYAKGRNNKAFRNRGYDWETFSPKEWQEDAACKGMNPQMFEVDGRLDDERKVEIAKAISVCKSCPVKKQCLEDASEMDLATTIRGGTYTGMQSNGYADPCTKCGSVAWTVFRKGGGRKPSRRCGECSRNSSKAWREKQAAAKLAT